MNRRIFLTAATFAFGLFAFTTSATPDEPFIVQNRNLTSADTRIIVNDHPNALVLNCTSEKISDKYVFDCHRNGHLRFEDVRINDGSGWNIEEGNQGVVYRAGIKLGTNQVPADGNVRTELLRVQITNIGTPSGDYNQVNQDGLTVDSGGRVYIRECYIDGVSDGCVDSKTGVTARGCTFKRAFRNLRMHGPDTKHYIWDCAFENTLADGEHIWFYNSSIKI
jgi:hypothetical protein